VLTKLKKNLILKDEIKQTKNWLKKIKEKKVKQSIIPINNTL
jgi:hypothetical protein